MDGLADEKLSRRIHGELGNSLLSRQPQRTVSSVRIMVTPHLKVNRHIDIGSLTEFAYGDLRVTVEDVEIGYPVAGEEGPGHGAVILPSIAIRVEYASA